MSSGRRRDRTWRPGRVQRGSLAVAALWLVASGCGGGDREGSAPPGQLSFDPIVTFPGPDGSGAGEVGQAGVVSALGDATPSGVVVGEAVGSSLRPRSGPSEDDPVVVELANPTEIGGPLVVQLVDRDPDLHPEAWVEVNLPVRPNGTTGWVRVADLELSRNPFRITIDASDHRLEVWRGEQPWIQTTVGIGTGATPTPRGDFYVIELLQPPDPGGLYGPYAFGLSGFSESLRSYAGGDGVIGIHGTDQPEALGTDVSHGCIRVHNDVITELAGVIPLGTPVHITD